MTKTKDLSKLTVNTRQGEKSSLHEMYYDGEQT